MRNESVFKLSSNVRILLRDAKSGRIVTSRRVHNKVVLAGRNLIRDLIAGTMAHQPTHMAMGTGTTAPADSDVALQTQVYQNVITTRISLSSKVTFQLFIPQTDANGFTLTEAGLQNVRTSDATTNLFARATFNGIVKTGSTTATISWDVTIASS